MGPKKSTPKKTTKKPKKTTPKGGKCAKLGFKYCAKASCSWDGGECKEKGGKTTKKPKKTTPKKTTKKPKKTTPKKGKCAKLGFKYCAKASCSWDGGECKEKGGKTTKKP